MSAFDDYRDLCEERDSLRAELAELRARAGELERQVRDKHEAATVDEICNAYESGDGHRGRPTASVNPYRKGSDLATAYNIGALGDRESPAAAPVPDDVAKDADPEYAWSLCGEEYHDRLDTREAAIAELDGSGGFTGRVVDAYDACGECDIAEVIVDQVENWLSDSVPSDDFIIDVTEEQKDALNSIVWEWFYKNVSPNRWTVTDVHQHEAAILAAKENKP